ncbi:MAG: 50S ribosomal protein L9 [Nitrospinota bacterium]|nr:50S ribosomal protein L9 [Nitrospinota bacterium]
MKLLLKDDVENLGFCGDEVEVKDGYGRNYLIPAGKAILATPKNKKAFDHQKSVVQAKLRKFKNAAEEVSQKICSISCVFTKKVGEQGKLFGSVTSQEIATFLKDKGFEIDRRKIQIKEPIKSLGDFKVPVKLHAEVMAEINVTVLKDETVEEVQEASQEEVKEVTSGEENSTPSNPDDPKKEDA